MKKKIFIDGKAGTTGLRIEERLSGRDDVEIISLPEELRKDTEARREILNKADVVFLCLPDAAAKEAVSMIENEDVVVIDASTAHRTNPDWAYGLPELSPEFEQKIKDSKRIAVPGCHASGFIALVYPLIKSGMLNPDALLSVHSITGYSGGGKSMIADYKSEERSELLCAPRQYALSQSHKHLPEMVKITGLNNASAMCNSCKAISVSKTTGGSTFIRFTYSLNDSVNNKLRGFLSPHNIACFVRYKSLDILLNQGFGCCV